MDLEQIIKQMTLQEKVALCAGSDMWHSTAIERLGIPALKMTDGPNGARGDGVSGKSAASFPVGSALGATWNRALLEEVGCALGQEAKTKQAQVLLGPTVNLHRTPLGGRNFECYSEDPYLSGMLATAFIRGVQSEQVAACVKHFVCNDSEFERHAISSDVDERTLRELYLLPFEMAVADANPWSIMSSYNRVNGIYASSHDRLLRGVLKGEWGFDGLVVSDWGAALETIENANGGLDIEMPGPTASRGAALLAAVKDGKVAESTIDDSVRRVLGVLERTGKFSVPDELPEESRDLPEHRALACRAAEESMVLIANRTITDGKYAGQQVLPINPKDVKTLAIIGPNAAAGQIQGGGSSGVMPHYKVMPLPALRESYQSAEVFYEVGCHNHKYLPEPETGTLFTDDSRTETGFRLQMYQGEGCQGQTMVDRRIATNQSMMGAIPLNFLMTDQMERGFSATLTGIYQPAESGKYEFGLFSSGLTRLFLDNEELIDNWTQQLPGDSFFGMGSAEKRVTIDVEKGRAYNIRIEFQDERQKMITGLRYGMLPPVPTDLLERAVKAAAKADAVILVVGSNSDWDTEGNDRLHLDLPGEQNLLIKQVLATNKRSLVVMNTGGAMDMPWLDEAGAVIQAWLPGQEFGHALANIISGEAVPSARMPTTFPRRLEDTPANENYPGEAGHVRYGERIFMGYRWYDARDIEPLVSFGHGLSYTEFDFAKLDLPRKADAGEVIHGKLEICNTGGLAAQEVIQVYVRDLKASVQRPEQELKAFEKVFLEPGETRVVEFELGFRAFAFWDLNADKWQLESGDFEIRVGASSRDIRQSRIVTLL